MGLSKNSPSGRGTRERIGQAGGHAAPIDTQGMDPEMIRTLQTPTRRPFTSGGDPDLPKSSPSTVNVPEGLSHAQRMEWLDTEAKIKDRQQQIAAKRGERYLAPDTSSRTIKRD